MQLLYRSLNLSPFGILICLIAVFIFSMIDEFLENRMKKRKKLFTKFTKPAEKKNK